MAALDGAAHGGAEEREQPAADVFDVREQHGPVALVVGQELTVSGEEPVPADVAVPLKRCAGVTSGNVAFTLGDGRPGIPSVSNTVSPGRRPPLIEGRYGFHSPYESKSTSTAHT